jgi:hypothetical protein
MSLYDSFDYMQAENIVWLGPTGCGNRLATGFLRSGSTAVIAAIHHSRNWWAKHIVVGRSFGRAACKYTYDCLVIDGLGYTDGAVAVAVFTLMLTAPTKTTLITSIWASYWNSF